MLRQNLGICAFIVTTDGLLGPNANDVLDCLARKLASKLKAPEGVISGSGWIKAKIAVTVALKRMHMV